MRIALRLLLVSALFLAAGAAEAGKRRYHWPVTGVYDGDTIHVRLVPMPPELVRSSVRVDGVDTPELRGKCAAERALARRARDFTRARVAAARRVEFVFVKREKFGRVLAQVYLDGESLAPALIAAGLARPYHGEKRGGWCGPPP